MEKIQLIKTDV